MKKPNPRDAAFVEKLQPLEVRKARQTAEAPVAAKEYADKAQAAIDRMAKLKAERLAREKISP
jgi:hypothetical protein